MMIRPSPAGRRIRLLELLCCLVYFVSYLTRINYAAALSELAAGLDISNELASLAVMVSFLTYGLGQILCGFLGDTINPRRMIAAGLAATSLCNILLPLMPGVYSMAGLWGLNGFFQSMLWPPLVRVMAENLPEADYRRTCVAVSAAASFGTVAVYLMVPACIWISDWRLAFTLPAVLGIATAAVWLAGTRTCAGGSRSGNTAESGGASPLAQRPGLWALIRRSALLPLMAVIILQGILRDGITTWMPTYINDLYCLGTSFSILTTAILPLFSIISVTAANAVQKHIAGEVTVAALMFGTGFAATAGLYLFFSSTPALPIICMAIITGCMHGVNTMLIGRLPRHFAPYGRVSSVAGLLNAFTYVGSALSTYGIAAISSRWGCTAFAGTLLCALCIRRWNRFAVAAGAWPGCARSPSNMQTKNAPSS